MAKTYDLTNGKVLPVILNFFFPMFFTNMLQQVYTIADTAVVGKGIGDNALAAVGNMSSLSFLVVGFSVGLAGGFCVSVAQNYGARKYDELRKSIASAIKLSLIVSVILTAVSMVVMKPVLILLQTDDKILMDSLIYGYIIFGGLIATIAYNLCAGILRALGDSKTPFAAIIISTLTNIVLNCIFIFGFRAGVGGAAVATVISQVISTLICYRRLRKIDIIKLSAADFRTDFKMYSILLGNGIPMALMNSITAVGCMVVQYFVNGLGVAYTSAYSTCSKYLNLAMQPACTAGVVMSSFASQNFGAQKYSRIREGLYACLGIALVSYVLLGSVMVIFPEQLAKLMLNGDEQIALVGEFLPLCGVMLIAVDFLFVFRSGCQGMGYPLIPMISGIVEMVMRIMVIVLFISQLGFRATACAEIVAWSGAFALNFAAFRVYLNKHIKSEGKPGVKLSPAIN